MKKAHIAFIIVIALVIGAMVNSLFDASSYANFNLVFANEGQEFHVVGELDRDQETIYDPKVNPDLFIFHMVDDEGNNQKVFLHMSKPPDFERSEKIVLIGKAEGGEFHANDILMKCPSKYDDGTPEFKSPKEMADS